MSACFVTLIGNVGQDPTIRQIDAQRRVADFSIAVNDVYSNGGQRVERTNWYRIAMWGSKADQAMNLIKKGRQISLSGRLRIREYTDKDGNSRLSFDVEGHDFNLISTGLGQQGEGGGAPGGSYGSQPASGGAAPRRQDPVPDTMAPSADDDDLPF